MKKYRVVRKGFDESRVLVGPRTGNFMYFVEESYITWFGFGKESWRIANGYREEVTILGKLPEFIEETR